MKNNNSLTKNTMVLFISMLITKAVGAIFKIPLTNIIGGVGMAYYSSAYSLYTPVFALTAAAVPTVLIREIAANAACSRMRNAEKIFKVSLALFGFTGFAGTALMLLFAKPFADLIAHSPESVYSIVIISPSVLLCCFSSVLKGYYEGLSNMIPTAVSQIAESVCRAIFGLAAANGVLAYAAEAHAKGLPVFGTECTDMLRAAEAASPYAAAAAISAVTLSELVCLLCLIIRKKFFKKCYNVTDRVPSTEKTSVIVKRLIKESIPIALCSIAINLSSFIDLITIPRCISFALNADSSYFYDRFGYLIEENGGLLRLSDFIYGSYTGVAGTVFALIPAFTGMFGKSAMPDIAAAWSVKNKPLLKRMLGMVIKSNFIIGFPLYLGMAVMAEPILKLLYSGRPLEAGISTQPLFILCIGGVFLTLTSTCYSVFQMIGRADLPIKLTVISSAVKLILNVFLISVPQININGAALSNLAAYAVSAFGGYFALEHVSGIDFKIFTKMRAPLAASAGCCVTAVLCRYYLQNSCNDILLTSISVAASGTVYIILLMLQGDLDVKNLLFRRKC